jgi:hypothetical protein
LDPRFLLAISSIVSAFCQPDQSDHHLVGNTISLSRVLASWVYVAGTEVVQWCVLDVVDTTTLPVAYSQLS